MADKRILIESVQIKNFRSIRNEILQVKDFNIFVGLNDAGKSNFLKALLRRQINTGHFWHNLI